MTDHSFPILKIRIHKTQPHLQGQVGMCPSLMSEAQGWGRRGSIFYVEAFFILCGFKLHSAPTRWCFIFPLCQNWQLRPRKVKQLAQGHTARPK